MVRPKAEGEWSGRELWLVSLHIWSQENQGTNRSESRETGKTLSLSISYLTECLGILRPG